MVRNSTVHHERLCRIKLHIAFYYQRTDNLQNPFGRKSGYAYGNFFSQKSNAKVIGVSQHGPAAAFVSAVKVYVTQIWIVKTDLMKRRSFAVGFH